MMLQLRLIVAKILKERMPSKKKKTKKEHCIQTETSSVQMLWVPKNEDEKKNCRYLINFSDQ